MQKVRSAQTWLLYGGQVSLLLLLFAILPLLSLGCKRMSPQASSNLNEEKEQSFSITSLSCLWMHVYFGNETFQSKDHQTDIFSQNTLTLCKNLKEERKPLLLKRANIADFIFVELADEFYGVLDDLELKELKLSYQIFLTNDRQISKISEAEITKAQLMKKVLLLPLKIKIAQLIASENLQLLMHITFHYQGLTFKQINITPVILY